MGPAVTEGSGEGGEGEMTGGPGAPVRVTERELVSRGTVKWGLHGSERDG